MTNTAWEMGKLKAGLSDVINGSRYLNNDSIIVNIKCLKQPFFSFKYLEMVTRDFPFKHCLNNLHQCLRPSPSYLLFCCLKIKVFSEPHLLVEPFSGGNVLKTSLTNCIIRIKNSNVNVKKSSFPYKNQKMFPKNCFWLAWQNQRSHGLELGSIDTEHKTRIINSLFSCVGKHTYLDKNLLSYVNKPNCSGANISTKQPVWKHSDFIS